MPVDSYEAWTEATRQLIAANARIAELERETARIAKQSAQNRRERDQARADAVALYNPCDHTYAEVRGAQDRIRAYAAGKPVTVYTREDLAKAWDGGLLKGFGVLHEWQLSASEQTRRALNPYASDAQPVSVEPDREALMTAWDDGAEFAFIHGAMTLDEVHSANPYRRAALAEHDRAAGRKEQP